MSTNTTAKTESGPFSVCHVLSRFETGGLENGIVNLCNGHDRARFRPFICCVKAGGSMAARLNPDVRLDILGSPEGKAPFRFLKLARYFRATRPDIVHTHGWGQSAFDGVVGARLAGVPVVINGEHGTFSTKMHQIPLQRFIALLCNKTLSVSHAHKQKVVDVLGISPRRIGVIHNGVDTSRFTGSYDIHEIIRNINAEYSSQIDESMFVIGCVGSIKHIKNQQLLINAAAILHKRKSGKKYTVLFVGQGPDMQKLKLLCASLNITDNVLFLGERTDVPELLSIMHVLVLPSQTGKEGLPNVVLEAFSSGVPVISTQSTGTHEVMVDGQTGWFLSSEDPVELANRLCAMMDDPAARVAMSRKAREHVEKHFTIEKMVCSYEELYTTLLRANT